MHCMESLCKHWLMRQDERELASEDGKGLMNTKKKLIFIPKFIYLNVKQFSDEKRVKRIRPFCWLLRKQWGFFSCATYPFKSIDCILFYSFSRIFHHLDKSPLPAKSCKNWAFVLLSGGALISFAVAHLLWLDRNLEFYVCVCVFGLCLLGWFIFEGGGGLIQKTVSFSLFKRQEIGSENLP